jgi:hypothetical protein
MAQTYFLIPTAEGEAKLANAQALGVPLKFTAMSVGDGNGALPIPNRDRKTLINERRRASINSLTTDPANASQFIAEQVIPETEGGWWIREAGIHSEDGTLCYYANVPETYKPVLAEGSARTQVIRLVCLNTSGATVELKVDPSIVLATRGYVDTQIASELDKRDGKQSVLVATTAPLAALSGLQTIDGVALTAGGRVLVKDQLAGKDNGIYVAATGAWTRAADADSGLDVTPGMLVPIEQGTVNGDSVWQLTTDSAIIIGATPLSFRRVGDGYFAPLNGGADFSGIVKVDTAPVGTATRQAASTAYVAAAIAALVGSSPAALDTLNELAAALGNDPNFATTVLSGLASKANLSGADFFGPVSGQTPARQDNDTSLVTSEWVNTRGAQYAAPYSVVAHRVLTAADAGAIGVIQAAGLQITLPNAASVLPGTTFTFYVYDIAFNPLIKAAAGNTISTGAGSFTQFGANGTGYITLVAESGAVWQASGTAILGASSSFACQALANGFQQLPSGIILQWTAAVVNGSLVVTLPKAFPNAQLSCIATSNNTSPAFAYSASPINPSQVNVVTQGAGAAGVSVWSIGY